MNKLDLKTRFINPGHKIYVLHPGQKKKFYQEFTEKSVVFLDLPGTNLPNQIDLENINHTSAIYMGRKISMHLRGLKDGKLTRNPLDYSVQASRSKSARYMTEAKTLYSTAKAGDLIIVPGSGYMSKVFIGEFTENHRSTFSTTARIYKDERIPARKVRWIHSSKLKAHFSDRLIQLMQNRQALIEISNEIDKKEIYDLCYKEYTSLDQAQGRIKITKSKIDLREMVDANDFISYFIAMYSAQQKGHLDKLFNMHWKEAADEYYDRDLLIDTSYSINSPGWVRLKSLDLKLPAFVAVMLCLSSSNMTIEQASQTEIINSAMVSDDQCILDISNSVREALNMMNADQWEQTCRAMQNANESVGLMSTMEVIEN